MYASSAPRLPLSSSRVFLTFALFYFVVPHNSGATLPLTQSWKQKTLHDVSLRPPAPPPPSPPPHHHHRAALVLLVIRRCIRAANQLTDGISAQRTTGFESLCDKTKCASFLISTPVFFSRLTQSFFQTHYRNLWFSFRPHGKEPKARRGRVKRIAATERLIRRRGRDYSRRAQPPRRTKRWQETTRTVRLGEGRGEQEKTTKLRKRRRKRNG